MAFNTCVLALRLDEEGHKNRQNRNVYLSFDCNGVLSIDMMSVGTEMRENVLVSHWNIELPWRWT